MAKRVTTTETPTRKIRPALTPEAMENQMVALAVNLAEKKLLDGTASPQIITHYLKMASTKERIENEILEKKKDLIVAKTQSLQSAQHVEELIADALAAMKRYSGQGDDVGADSFWTGDFS